MRLLSIIVAWLVATSAVLAYQPGDIKAVIQMQSLKTALDQFEFDLGRYPTTSEGLGALAERPAGTPLSGWRGPYAESVQDPWRRDLVYRFPGVHNTNGFDLYSRGEDGVSRSGGDDADDINNWDPSQPWRKHYAHAAHVRQVRPFLYILAVAVCLGILALWTGRISDKGDMSRS